MPRCDCSPRKSSRSRRLPSILESIAGLADLPRQILKVTEALRVLDFAALEDGSDIEVPSTAGAEADAAVPAHPTEPAPGPSLLVLQFQMLLSMLTILHPRIKTQYPSRFLATTLQAVLVAFQRAGSQGHLLTDSILSFVKSLSGSARPQLPPRTPSGNIIAAALDTSKLEEAAASEAPEAAEVAMQRRLLQSFTTHVLEDYMLSLHSSDDVPGLAWSSRYMEKTSPATIPDVPGRVAFAARFASEEPFIERSSALGQIVAVAQDLKLLDDTELLQLCLDTSVESSGQPNREDEPPSAVEDIPLSKTGALFLFAAGMARQTLFDVGSKPSALSIFPQHETILKNFTGDPSDAGHANEAIIDAILFLALVSLENNKIGEPKDEQDFNTYLQILSLISANCPSPTLRYNAHYLVTTILRSHPSDIVRLAFIRDTLEHCPYENLKASAVGWLKGETIEANLVPLMRSQGRGGPSSEDTAEENLFAMPVALTMLAPYIFDDLTLEIGTAVPLDDAWMHFKTNMTFYLTVLNFYYFLLKAKPLHKVIDLKGLHNSHDIGSTTLAPLVAAVGRFDKELAGGELEGEAGEEAPALRAELGIFTELIANITSERATVNQE